MGIKKETVTDTFVSITVSFMVPVTGLEPVRCRQRWILSPLRLPIPSHRQVCFIYIPQLPLAIYIVAAFGGVMSPPFAVPGDVLGVNAGVPHRPLHLLRPRLLRHRRRSGSHRCDFESTTSTIPSHRQDLPVYYTTFF